MAATTAATHRVVCAAHTETFGSLNAAQGYLSGVESAGHCREFHTVEVLTDGEWLPRHVAMARAILAAEMLQTADTFDGPLTKVAAGWSAGHSTRVNAQFAVTGSEEWRAAMGPHHFATLSADGRTVRVESWCTCGGADTSEKWVRYERWDTSGRVAHGYVCPSCRFITQTG